jgi:hypothetical protein
LRTAIASGSASHDRSTTIFAGKAPIARPSGTANFIGHLRRSDVTTEPDMNSAYATHSASISMIPLRHPSGTVRRYGLWTVNSRAALRYPRYRSPQNSLAIARPSRAGPRGGEHLRIGVDTPIVRPKRRQTGPGCAQGVRKITVGRPRVKSADFTRRDHPISDGSFPVRGFRRTAAICANRTAGVEPRTARAPSPCPLPHPKGGGSGIAARWARSRLRRTRPSSAMSIPSQRTFALCALGFLRKLGADVVTRA